MKVDLSKLGSLELSKNYKGRVSDHEIFSGFWNWNQGQQQHAEKDIQSTTGIVDSSSLGFQVKGMISGYLKVLQTMTELGNLNLSWLVKAQLNELIEIS